MAEVIIDGVRYRQNMVNLQVIRCGAEPTVICKPDWVLTVEEMELVIPKLLKEG